MIRRNRKNAIIAFFVIFGFVLSANNVTAAGERCQVVLDAVYKLNDRTLMVYGNVYDLEAPLQNLYVYTHWYVRHPSGAWAEVRQASLGPYSDRQQFTDTLSYPYYSAGDYVYVYADVWDGSSWGYAWATSQSWQAPPNIAPSQGGFQVVKMDDRTLRIEDTDIWTWGFHGPVLSDADAPPYATLIWMVHWYVTHPGGTETEVRQVALGPYTSGTEVTDYLSYPNFVPGDYVRVYADIYDGFEYGNGWGSDPNWQVPPNSLPYPSLSQITISGNLQYLIVTDRLYDDDAPSSFPTLTGYLHWFVKKPGGSWTEVRAVARGPVYTGQMVYDVLSQPDFTYGDQVYVYADIHDGIDYGSGWATDAITIPYPEYPKIGSVVYPSIISDNVPNLSINIQASHTSGIASVVVNFLGKTYPTTLVGDIYTAVIPNPRDPGDYTFQVVVTSSNGFTTSQYFSFVVFDDDSNPPTITNAMSNLEIKDCEPSVNLDTSITDASGIAGVKVTFEGEEYPTSQIGGGIFRAIIPNPLVLGQHEFTVTAWDADSDRNNDQSFTSMTFSFVVVDDDTSPPEIANAMIDWEILDCEPTVNIDISAADTSGISGIIVTLEGVDYLASPLGGDIFRAVVPNPLILGQHEFTVTAWDADNDRNNDQSFISMTFSFVVVDDDTSPPEIANAMIDWEILDCEPTVNIDISAADASGIDEVIVTLAGVDYFASLISGDIFRAVVPNPILLGEHSLTVTAWDADNDRSGDQCFASTTFSFIVVDDDILTPVINYIYTGDGTDGNPGTLIVSAFDPANLGDDSGLMADPSGIYKVQNMIDVLQTFSFTAIDSDNEPNGLLPDDSLATSVTISIMLVDDDLTAPTVMVNILGWFLNPTGGVDVIFEVSATDPESGIDLESVDIWAANQHFTTLGIHVITLQELGTFSITALVKNADLDRGAVDQEESTSAIEFSITADLVKDLILSEIDVGIAQIQASSDEDWRKPGDKRKAEMITNLGELRALVEAGQYTDAYDLLLHDIKPKLTGLKTNEDDVAWGNGIFDNPWVEDSTLQEQFRLWANAILHGLLLQ